MLIYIKIHKCYNNLLLYLLCDSPYCFSMSLSCQSGTYTQTAKLTVALDWVHEVQACQFTKLNGPIWLLALCHALLFLAGSWNVSDVVLGLGNLMIFCSIALHLPCLHVLLLAMPHTAVIQLVALWKVSCNWGQSWNNLNWEWSALWQCWTMSYAKIFLAFKFFEAKQCNDVLLFF